MALFKALSGNRANLPEEKREGYVYFCEDDGSFHFDYKDAAGALQRKQINAKDAETLCGMTLDEIKTHVTVQSDWAQTNSAAADYIKNKPSIPTKLSDLSEDDNHRTVTLEEKTKLESAVTTTEFNEAIARVSDVNEETSSKINELKASSGVGYIEGETIHTIDPKFLPSGSTSATPDFAQNDPTAADYIKNRPFYKESERTVVYEGIVNGGDGNSTTVNNGETIETYLFYDVFYDSSNYSYTRGIKDNETYIVTFDGTEYILNSHRVDSYNSFYIGNERMVSYIGTQNSDVPFALTTSYNDDDSISTVTLHMLDSNSHTIKIVFEDVTYNKLAIEYIPDEIRSNWEQNDPSAINYIENRPFYQAGRIGKTEIKETTVNTTWIDENSLWQAEVPYAGFFSSSDLRASMYEVVIDGIKYIVPYTQVYSTAGYLGVEDINNSQEYPFSFWTVNGYGGTVVWRLGFATEGPHTVKVTQLIGYSIVQLDEKFIPDTIARVSDVNEETSSKINELKASGGIGYEEFKRVEFLPETTLQFTYEEEASMMISIVPGVDEDFFATNATVVWDGVIYHTKVLERDNRFYFGNIGALEGNPTEEPFIVEVDINEGYAMVAALDEGETHTVSISVESEVIKTLDPKYFPVIDLGELDGDKEKEVPKRFEKLLDEAVGKSYPVTVRYSFFQSLNNLYFHEFVYSTNAIAETLSPHRHLFSTMDGPCFIGAVRSMRIVAHEQKISIYYATTELHKTANGWFARIKLHQDESPLTTE